MQIQNRYPFSIIYVSNNEKRPQAFIQKVYPIIGFGNIYIYIRVAGFPIRKYNIIYFIEKYIATMRFGPNVYNACVCDTLRKRNFRDYEL